MSLPHLNNLSANWKLFNLTSNWTSVSIPAFAAPLKYYQFLFKTNFA